jgi:tRNA A37 N6-isopentenylltransferase MiaA
MCVCVCVCTVSRCGNYERNKVKKESAQGIRPNEFRKIMKVIEVVQASTQDVSKMAGRTSRVSFLH